MVDEQKSGVSTPADFEGVLELEALPLHSTDLISVLDESGTVLYKSPAITRILGYEPEAVIGSNLLEHIHPADREEVVSAFDALKKSDTSSIESVEARHKRADGTWQWLESTGSSTPTPNGYYVINSRDVSTRKRREENIIRKNEQLERFAHVVSHDLRNPLNIAEGHLALLAERSETPSDESHIEEIQNAHRRMQTLIEELLVLAKRGDVITDTTAVHLGDVVERCWKTVETHDAVLENTVDSTVIADEQRLSQLLANLFRNAIDHGGTDVVLTVGRCDDGFYVEDDGDGVPDDVRDAIFDSGFSTNDGTGLGLDIVETIAAAHGWTVTLLDGRSGGARFEITGVDIGPPT